MQIDRSELMMKVQYKKGPTIRTSRHKFVGKSYQIANQLVEQPKIGHRQKENLGQNHIIRQTIFIDEVNSDRKEQGFRRKQQNDLNFQYQDKQIASYKPILQDKDKLREELLLDLQSRTQLKESKITDRYINNRLIVDEPIKANLIDQGTILNHKEKTKRRVVSTRDSLKSAVYTERKNTHIKTSSSVLQKGVSRDTQRNLFQSGNHNAKINRTNSAILYKEREHSRRNYSYRRIGTRGDQINKRRSITKSNRYYIAARTIKDTSVYHSQNKLDKQATLRLHVQDNKKLGLTRCTKVPTRMISNYLQSNHSKIPMYMLHSKQNKSLEMSANRLYLEGNRLIKLSDRDQTACSISLHKRVPDTTWHPQGKGQKQLNYVADIARQSLRNIQDESRQEASNLESTSLETKRLVHSSVNQSHEIMRLSKKNRLKKSMFKSTSKESNVEPMLFRAKKSKEYKRHTKCIKKVRAIHHEASSRNKDATRLVKSWKINTRNDVVAKIVENVDQLGRQLKKEQQLLVAIGIKVVGIVLLLSILVAVITSVVGAASCIVGLHETYILADLETILEIQKEVERLNDEVYGKVVSLKQNNGQYDEIRVKGDEEIKISSQNVMAVMGVAHHQEYILDTVKNYHRLFYQIDTKVEKYTEVINEETELKKRLVITVTHYSMNEVMEKLGFSEEEKIWGNQLAYSNLADLHTALIGTEFAYGIDDEPVISEQLETTEAYCYPVNDGAFLSRLTSSYGERWGSMHYGNDFAYPIGTKVYAVACGKVTVARADSKGIDAGGGLMIFIEHPNGLETRYMHLSDFAVEVGDQVQKGQLIGYTGNTGASTGPHLHFELLDHGMRVDSLSLYRVK